MDIPPSDWKRAPIPDSVLDDYALGRLPEERRVAIEQLVRRDPALRDRLDRAAEDVRSMLAFLESHDSKDEETSLTDEDLALYLDQALSPEDRSRVEACLASDHSARERLVVLYRDVKGLVEPDVDPGWAVPRLPPRLLDACDRPAPRSTGIGRYRARMVPWPAAVATVLAATSWGAAFATSGHLRLVGCFLGLAAFSYGTVVYVSRPRATRSESAVPSPRRIVLSKTTLVGAVALFSAGVLWPAAALWLLSGGTALLWLWLLGRVTAPSRPVESHLRRIVPEGNQESAKCHKTAQ